MLSWLFQDEEESNRSIQYLESFYVDDEFCNSWRFYWKVTCDALSSPFHPAIKKMFWPLWVYEIWSKTDFNIIMWNIAGRKDYLKVLILFSWILIRDFNLTRCYLNYTFTIIISILWRQKSKIIYLFTCCSYLMAESFFAQFFFEAWNIVSLHITNLQWNPLSSQYNLWIFGHFLKLLISTVILVWQNDECLHWKFMKTDFETWYDIGLHFFV